MIKSSIITIGDELLIGQVIDTNSAWMAEQLNQIGIPVLRRVAVGDNWDEIWNTLDAEREQADIIFITGGLGPTSDDITKPLLCKYFNATLVMNQEALANVTHLFEQVLKRPMIELNRKQAEVPDNCKVIQNKRGTAPGMWFDVRFKNRKQIFVSMPGVPHEMKGMMEDEVLPLLQKEFPFHFITHRTLLTAGIGESFLAERLKEFEASLPAFIKLAYLPNFGMVRVRLSSSGNDKEAVENLIEKYFEELQKTIPEFLVANEDEPLEKVIGKLLLAKNKTVSTAESCTGGTIASLITSVPGASAYFKGSIVSYSDEIKENLLNVNTETIRRFGAVSKETVEEMVKGILEKMSTNYAIAISGIMGPGGGSEEKPVGTVWMSVGNKHKIETQKMYFRYDRMRNIQASAVSALNMLRKFINEND